MRKYIYIVLASLIGFASCTSEGKQLRRNIRAGNSDYKKGDFVGAEIDYRKALDEDIRSTDASFNLGNSLFRQRKGEDAFKQYRSTIENTEDKEMKAKSFHNVGNMLMLNQQPNLQEAINVYKEALRNNPKDDETRHNLAIAQYLLQNQSEQEKEQDQQDQQQDDQQQDDQQEQQQEQQQDQQEQQQDDQQEQQEQQQQNSSEMSQEQAEQILDALMQSERDTQEKVQLQEQQKADQRTIDKNW